MINVRHSRQTNKTCPQIEAKDLAFGYENIILMRDLNFVINKGDIFIIMGRSGCGKSSLLKILIGLKSPHKGSVFYSGVDFWNSSENERQKIMKRFGTLYQSSALWSSMTLAENVALPLERHTFLSPKQIREVASLKLALVGLGGFEDYYPSEISGGMRKRAGIARAMALDPEMLFLDEPSAGLDPISARLLDELMLELRESLGTTFVVVTHELSSIFCIGNNSVFLDEEAKTITAYGDPKELLEKSNDPKLINFLTRGVGRKE